MVSLNDGGHDHGDGPVCPGCQFKAELAEHLEWANGHSEEAWLDLTGELMVLMGTALSMLTALRMSHVEGAESPHSTAASAAAAISRLGGVIDETWHMVMDDEHDDLGDDEPGTAL